MRIAIDLDGTICPIKKEDQSYQDLKPFPEAVVKLKELKAQGHYIIIQTARNMATQKSNLGKVLKNVGKTTLNWLDKYEIPYDEIYFGKPNAHIYIDDRAVRFENWTGITLDFIQKLSKEK